MARNYLGGAHPADLAGRFLQEAVGGAGGNAERPQNTANIEKQAGGRSRAAR